MSNLFIEYPKCTTCQKAKKWLNINNIKFEDRHIAVSYTHLAKSYLFAGIVMLIVLVLLKSFFENNILLLYVMLVLGSSIYFIVLLMEKDSLLMEEIGKMKEKFIRRAS